MVSGDGERTVLAQELSLSLRPGHSCATPLYIKELSVTPVTGSGLRNENALFGISSDVTFLSKSAMFKTASSRCPLTAYFADLPVPP